MSCKSQLIFGWRYGNLLSEDKEGCHSAGYTTTAYFHRQHLLFGGMVLGIHLIVLFFHRYKSVSMVLGSFSCISRCLDSKYLAKPSIEKTASNSRIHGLQRVRGCDYCRQLSAIPIIKQLIQFFFYPGGH
jgi:hypothetical protein